MEVMELINGPITGRKGVYCIRCKKNDHVYYGSSLNLREHKKQHCKQLRKNKHSNPGLQEDFNRYGIKEFEFIVIERVSGNSEKLKMLELEFIKDIEECYNVQSRKEVYSFNVDNDFLNKYPSLSHAAKDTNVPLSHIASCARTGGIAHDKYKFSYSTTPVPFVKKQRKKRPVCQYEIDGTLKHIFDDIDSVLEEIKGARRSLLKKLRSSYSGTKYWRGFLWKYEQDPMDMTEHAEYVKEVHAKHVHI